MEEIKCELVKTMTCADEPPADLREEPIKLRWKATCGPRQAKEFEKALSDIRMEGRTYIERTGLKSNPHESQLTQLFGNVRPGVNVALQKIFDGCNGEITAENVRELIAQIQQAKAELVASRPVHDLTKTEEEQGAEARELEAQRQELADASRQREADIQKHVAEVRGNYSFVESRRQGESDHAWVGRTIRADLALAFPGTTFSVRTDYNSANIGWEMGPRESRVKELLGKYERWSYRYSEDGPETPELREKRIKHEAVNRIVGGLTYVFLHRRNPEGLVEQVARELCVMKQIPFEDLRQKGLVEGEAPGDNLGDWAHRLIHKTDFPPRGEILRAEPDPECTDCSCFWKLVFKFVPQLPPASPMPASSPGPNGVVIRRNLAMEGLEIAFKSKPDRELINRIKALGFKWSGRNTCWYRKFSPESWSASHKLLGIAEPTDQASPPPPSAPDRFDMQVEDNMARACGLL